MIIYPHYSLVKNWSWANFTPAEMADRQTGKLIVVDTFMDRLQRVRTDYGKSLWITSGYRTPEHNTSISSTGASGPHTTGRAVDIAVAGDNAYNLIVIALRHGMTGIGVKQHGPKNKRYIHLDDLAPTDVPGGVRPWVWTYP